MKLSNKFLLTVLLIGVLSSCNEDFFDINSDPNNAVEGNITADLVLPQALLNTATRFSNSSFRTLNFWFGYWCPGGDFAPGTEEESYNISSTFNAGLFSGIMDNLNDYNFAERKATETGTDFYLAIAKTMKAHGFTTLVDIYNNVPYTEALKGLEFVRPKYDDGKFVYEESMKELDNAMALFQKLKAAGTIAPATSSVDVMFGGNVDLWMKFVNTLKLRLLIHQSARADRQSYITAEIAKIVSQGSGFLGSGQDAALNPGFTADKPNAFYASFGFTLAGTQATTFYRANKFAMDELKGDRDPRLGYFYKPIAQALPAGAAEPFPTIAPVEYRGNEYGRAIDNTTYKHQGGNFVSSIGGIATAGPVAASSFGLIKGYNMTAWIMTSVESMFLQAEAIQRGWLAGDKEAAYKAAVKESFRWLNVDKSQSAADAAFEKWYAQEDELNNVNVSYTDATDKLKVVLFQKYMALNGTLPLETWTDYRRNGAYPAVPLSINTSRTSPIIPVRFLYPQREYDLNEANVVANGTISQFTSKIWWMN
ncbi:MAG: SusD/RagB family nutrient-binding outer membrane lipoprotein [Haliscomenobacter sp.]|nr:SusD/RagB family nutrient-binding outer membrane lipoprotein [Haliscomenobacter sp.]